MEPERASSEFASKNLLQESEGTPGSGQRCSRQNSGSRKDDDCFPQFPPVRSRLDQPTAPGYSSAGTVVGVGEGITDLNVGDRVACAGAGYAVHAEFACVPRLLVAKIAPDCNADPGETAFTTVGAVALHGIRIAVK